MGITSAKTLLESHWNWLLGVPKGAFAAGAPGSLRKPYSIHKTKLGNQIHPPCWNPPSQALYNTWSMSGQVSQVSHVRQSDQNSMDHLCFCWVWQQDRIKSMGHRIWQQGFECTKSASLFSSSGTPCIAQFFWHGSNCKFVPTAQFF